ncbi:MAG: 23S rRNA (pseudouridine(1915)-N(3))-methyltransferase RlmH [Tenericutes bacterium]|jgi:23S rRNA (pseudouridine1915-N3)-methyltransferase|nr:23S rRNA (pseudouridine(1915)-N(3))-methyltransferase RlmH [Mycoplasmatota bacterium]
MKVKIVTVGKIKEKYLKNGITEYVKRLSRYVSLDLVEVNDERAPENLSPKEIEIIKDKEAERILSKVDKEYIIALDIIGKQLNSIELANKISDIFSYQSSEIVFIIGGSLGLSDIILKKANLRLSFSKLTFPHQLMKIILLEQIYRSFRIINNEPYHK